MLNEKRIWVSFLFEFRMGHKAVEQLATSTAHLAQELLMNVTVQWWFKKFCKGDENLEDEQHSDLPSEVDNDELTRSSQLILLQLQVKLLKNSTLTILWWFSIWSKLERWKSSIIGCHVRWPKIQKDIILKYCLLLFYPVTMKHFLVELWHATKSGFYMTAGDDQLSGWTE